MFKNIIPCCKRMTTNVGGAFMVRKSARDVRGQSSEDQVIPLEDERLGEVGEESTRGGNDIGKMGYIIHRTT